MSGSKSPQCFNSLSSNSLGKSNCFHLAKLTDIPRIMHTPKIKKFFSLQKCLPSVKPDSHYNFNQTLYLDLHFSSHLVFFFFCPEVFYPFLHIYIIHIYALYIIYIYVYRIHIQNIYVSIKYA